MTNDPSYHSQMKGNWLQYLGTSQEEPPSLTCHKSETDDAAVSKASFRFSWIDGVWMNQKAPVAKEISLKNV